MVGVRIKSNSQYDAKLAARNPQIIRLGDYVRCNQHLKHQCLTCGHVWDVLPMQVTTRKQNCPECDRKINNVHRRHTIDQYNKKLESMGSTLRALSYVNIRTKVEHQCLVCKDVFIKHPQMNIDNGAKCFSCSYPERFERSKRSKRVRFNGQIIRTMGYENHAIRYLVSKGIEKSDIVFGKDVPRVHYEGTIHFPDIYVISRNLLIEVKSLWTLIGSTSKWRMQIAKYNAALSQGFDYKLLVFERQGSRIRLPKNWFSCSRKQMLKILDLSYGYR